MYARDIVKQNIPLLRLKLGEELSEVAELNKLEKITQGAKIGFKGLGLTLGIWYLAGCEISQETIQGEFRGNKVTVIEENYAQRRTVKVSINFEGPVIGFTDRHVSGIDKNSDCDFEEIRLDGYSLGDWLALARKNQIDTSKDPVFRYANSDSLCLAYETVLNMYTADLEQKTGLGQLREVE